MKPTPLRSTRLIIATALAIGTAASAHEGDHSTTQSTTTTRVAETERPAQAQPFAKFPSESTLRWDEDYLYVDSDGMPDHELMVGIKRWIGRFPMPQEYTGKNTWSIPLTPIPAKEPISAKTNLFRGAIGVAANGIAIFSPLTGGGRDTYLAGELDQFGGHAGNGEDYHYHISPLHLQETLGKELPVGYALDGYPIYGLTESDGAEPKGLDDFNGHEHGEGGYHYHSSKTFPYIHGGFHGEVRVEGDHVVPQARSTIARSEPLRADRDAEITGWKVVDPNKSYELTFTSSRGTSKVSYALLKDGSWKFTFKDPSGETSEEIVKAGDRRKPGRAKRPRDGRKGGDRQRPRPRR